VGRLVCGLGQDTVNRRADLAFAALILMAGAVMHTIAFPKAAAAAEGSNLLSRMASTFKALWLIDSVTSLSLAVVLVAIVVSPALAAPRLVPILALSPLGTAIVIFATLGNFFPGYLMLAAGVAIVLAGLFTGSKGR